MKTSVSQGASIFSFGILILVGCLCSEAGNKCRPSGRIRRKKSPSAECNAENVADCCIEGKIYPTYECSPPVSSHTKAFLTLKVLKMVEMETTLRPVTTSIILTTHLLLALSTGWFNHKSRCHKNITISGNGGRSVVVMVVDECDSTVGCDADHEYQPPCDNNIVDATKAVWKALGVPLSQWGALDITWSDTNN